jgi:hypothetical protein
MTEIIRRTVAAILREAADAIERSIDQIDPDPQADPRVEEARVAAAPEALIPDQELLTLEQVAAKLQLKRGTLLKFIRRVQFPAIRGGNGMLFTGSDFLILREARRPRPRQFQAASLTTAPASGVNVQRRLAALRR